MRALLIRHAHTEAVGRYIAGRRAAVRLSEDGRRQAARLPGRLARLDVEALYTSPLERARETAAPIAARLGIEACVRDDLTEVDFGAWTGLPLDVLARLPEWQRFNAHRATSGIPGGEHPTDVQSRAVAALEELRARHRGTTIALVSHAEVIRSAVLHYLGMSLDHFHRIEISAASVTTLEIADEGPRLLCINEQDHV